MVEPKKLTRIALCGAILFVSQVALASLPNCELVTVLVVALTLTLGKEVIITCIVFAFLEMLVWGAGLWVLMYFYVWPGLVIIVLGLKKVIKDDTFLWAVVMGIWGLSYGLMCSLIYLPVGVSYAVVWWIAGIPFDIIHGISNFITGLVLLKPLMKVLNRLKRGDCFK